MSPRMNNSENNYINSDSDSNEEQYIENINNNEDDEDDENYGNNYYNDENTYKPEEPSLTKYNLVFCELYNTSHGTPNAESQHLFYHYLTIFRYKTLLNTEELESDMRCWNNGYEFIDDYSTLSPIRNIENIVTNDWYIKPEIAQCIVLESGHNVSILKTFWLRLVQRRWKNIFRIRKNILRLRCQPATLKFREVNGHWPANCESLPSIRGMLSNV